MHAVVMKPCWGNRIFLKIIETHSVKDYNMRYIALTTDKSIKIYQRRYVEHLSYEF
jgi:hypothetical protein